MKRQLSETLSCTHDMVDIDMYSFLKKRRALDGKPAKTIRSPRVRFATDLVQAMEIPAIVDQEEKERLFYSNNDFARFAYKERVRRDAMMLTVSLFREQARRIVRGSNTIPNSAVLVMYHKVMSRAFNLPTPNIEEESPQKKDEASSKDMGRKDILPASIKCRTFVSRCA